MRTEYILNKFLCYYRKNRSHKDEEWQPIGNKYHKDFKEYIHQLDHDGYIQKRDGIKNYQITIKGILFYNKGGYVGQRILFLISFAWKIFASTVVVVTAIIGTRVVYLDYTQSKEKQVEKEVRAQIEKEILPIIQKLVAKPVPCDSIKPRK